MALKYCFSKKQKLGSNSLPNCVKHLKLKVEAENCHDTQNVKFRIFVEEVYLLN